MGEQVATLFTGVLGLWKSGSCETAMMDAVDEDRKAMENEFLSEAVKAWPLHGCSDSEREQLSYDVDAFMKQFLETDEDRREILLERMDFDAWLRTLEIASQQLTHEVYMPLWMKHCVWTDGKTILNSLDGAEFRANEQGEYEWFHTDKPAVWDFTKGKTQHMIRALACAYDRFYGL